MSLKKSVKKILVIVAILFAIGGAIAFYLFKQPHRNVQATQTDFTLNSSAIVSEYLADANTANDKYLDSEGESKVLEIKGIVKEITEDYNGNKVVLLKSGTDKAGVSCTFTPETNKHTLDIKTGSEIRIKGVIRAGASYDSDMDLYENVIVEKCDLVNH